QTAGTITDYGSYSSVRNMVTTDPINVNGDEITIDIIADGQSAVALFNGHEQMTHLTGCGCVLSAISAAFLAVAPPAEGLRAAASLWAVCGELAYRQTQDQGLGAYHTALFNNLGLLDDKTVDGREKYEKLR
ncbi:MAG: hydroxyethylthiazole kinase, partial [Clostridia bacterium]|nr:hydroxyethylthiazole kinase [Clostridia bacterium]